MELDKELLDYHNQLVEDGTKIFAKQCETLYKEQFEEKIKAMTETVTGEMRSHIDTALQRHITKMSQGESGLYDYKGTGYDDDVKITDTLYGNESCQLSRIGITFDCESVSKSIEKLAELYSASHRRYPTHYTIDNLTKCSNKFIVYLLQSYIKEFIDGEHILLFCIECEETYEGNNNYLRKYSYYGVTNYARVIHIKNNIEIVREDQHNFKSEYGGAKLYDLGMGYFGVIECVHKGFRNPIQRYNFWIPTFILNILTNSTKPQYTLYMMQHDRISNHKILKQNQIPVESFNRILSNTKSALSDRRWVPLYVKPLVEENERLKALYTQYEKDKTSFDAEYKHFHDTEKPYLDLVETRKKLEQDQLQLEKDKQLLRVVKANLERRDVELKEKERQIKELDLDAILGSDEQIKQEQLLHENTLLKSRVYTAEKTAEVYRTTTKMAQDSVVVVSNMKNIND